MTKPELTDDQHAALVDLRGGCSCHISPPCFNCSEPITRVEMILLDIEIEEDDEEDEE
jgi:hypothetical protein